MRGNSVQSPSILKRSNGAENVGFRSGVTVKQKIDTLKVADYVELRANLTNSLYVGGDIVTVTNDKIAGIFEVISGSVTDNGGTEITDGGSLYAKRRFNSRIELDWYQPNADGTTSDNSLIDSIVYRNADDVKEVYITKADYAMTVFRPRNVRIIAEAGARILLTQGATPVMGQINDNVVLQDLIIESQESNLNLQRCSMENAENVKIIRGAVRGFRDTANPIDAWGLYLKNSKKIVLEQVGFASNDQSDIALVDDNEDVQINGCYGESGTFHINLEPNTSSNYNKNVTLNNMSLSKLSLLENGSGGTSNRSIVVNGCSIETLKYDGARVTFNSCDITDYEAETDIFFGEAKFINSLAIGPNLLEDPYMVNVGFNASAASTDANDWHINSVSSISNYLEPRTENGIRYQRINPDSVSGIVNLRPTTPISATAGDYYLVAITGRRANGSDGRGLQIYDTVGDKDCRIFRQTNNGYDYFVTEVAIVPASVTNDFLLKVGLYTTSPSSFDFYAVSVHKILGGQGGNVSEILGGIHSLKKGVRELVVDTVPTMSTAGLNGFQNGDRVVLSSTGASYYWGGSSFVAV